ncbi:MAG: ABC transporter ATP-binding protein [Proteobacteria bacterium]|nr:ABC transporter ATP-binding protein [Pseudomonadota bacterium]
MSEPILTAENLFRSYGLGYTEVRVLKGINLRLPAGAAVALVGASGVGKSTLLHILGALETPSSGRVLFQGQDLQGMSEGERARFRNRTIGFLFQFHRLLPDFTAWENVLIPARIRGGDIGNSARRAEELLARIGLKDRFTHRPAELSGGEQQRVALVRALILKPEILLADEPTGNLDQENAEVIIRLLAELNREEGVLLVLATHNEDLARRLAARIRLKDGQAFIDQVPENDPAYRGMVEAMT